MINLGFIPKFRRGRGVNLVKYTKRLGKGRVNQNESAVQKHYKLIFYQMVNPFLIKDGENPEN